MHTFEMAQAYRRDLEQAARHHRLVRYVQVGSPTRLSSAMVWAGRRLVTMGHFLEAHSQAAEAPKHLRASNLIG